MSKKKQADRPQARLPKGMKDIEAAEIRAMEAMLGVIRAVYESYGFEPLDTPAFEYTDALGKFLPDLDRPNEGVFSFEDEDGQWLSLRYDLTAPLARYVAANYETLPKPFRRYQTGPVWRNEKPGPGRFRQFLQFDADTVGAESVAADAEMCMLAADTLERLGIPRGQYLLKVNNRKILDGVMNIAGLGGEHRGHTRLIVLRAIDKLDRLGLDGVEQLLGAGRKDESGDFTKGAGLSPEQIELLLSFSMTQLGMPLNDITDSPEEITRLEHRAMTFENLETGEVTSIFKADNQTTIDSLRKRLVNNPLASEGIDELQLIAQLANASGYEEDRIRIDPSIVRGLDYYTGPVFEAELTFEVKNEDGQPVRFGSVGGGGRYDGLVERFRGVRIPATGFSVGVSRLYLALQTLKKSTVDRAPGPVVVLVMDRERLPDYQNMARELRNAGLRAEMYLGDSGLKAQMKYADRRGAPCVVIQGEDERARGEVTIKDLIEGSRLAAAIAGHTEWRETRPAQFSVKSRELVEAVRGVLARHKG